MDEQNQVQAQGSKGLLWLSVIAVIVLVAAGIWMWGGLKKAVAPSELPPGLDDTTSAIEQELNATDLGDINQEIQSTEQDLQSL